MVSAEIASDFEIRQESRPGPSVTWKERIRLATEFDYLSSAGKGEC